jgi:hypothetical protein
MARTVLTIQTIVIAGITPSYVSVDSANDHSFLNAVGDTFIHAKNTGAVSIFTFVPSATAGQGLTITSPTITIPATTGDKMMGPFDPGLFNQDSAVGVHLDVDVDGGVTLGAFRLPRI